MTNTKVPLPQRRLCCLLLAAGWLPGHSAAAQASGQGPELQAFTENLPPLNYAEDDQAQGFSSELLRLMAAEAGLPLRIMVMPWQRAVQEAGRQPLSVLFSLTRLPEREAHFRWVGPITPRRIPIYRLARRMDMLVRQDWAAGRPMRQRDQG